MAQITVEQAFQTALQQHQAGQLQQAEIVYRQILVRQPDHAGAMHFLGVIAHQVGRHDVAVDLIRRSIVLSPDLPEAYSNLGVALADLGRLDDAMAAYRQAIALKDDFVAAHFNYGMLLLLRGDFAQGWKEWEWRQETSALAPGLTQPQWTGGDAAGRTILLHSDRGFGYTIQFIRYVPMVLQRGARVMVLCQPELRRLLDGKWDVRWLDPGQPLPPLDMQCRLTSLPLAFGTTLQTIPHDVPYLRAPDDSVRKWREKLGREDGLRVGLTWAASASDKRSLPFSLLAPLTGIPGVRFYSLQKGPAAAQARQAGAALIDLTDDIHDFADTAALIANLDLVISVETSVAHLAGAMGKAVWTLVAFNGGWQWLLDRDDCPWYPTMRLFRQRAPGNWQSVIDEVAPALALAAAKPRGASAP